MDGLVVVGSHVESVVLEGLQSFHTGCGALGLTAATMGVVRARRAKTFTKHGVIVSTFTPTGVNSDPKVQD